MRASQYIYTSWRNGDSSDKGFMIYSKSTDINEIECSEIFFAMQYVVPRDLNLVPSEQEILDTFPYGFASFKLSTGRHCVAQSTYLGRDYSGRYGNYLVYALVFENEELDVYPVELFGQDYIKTYMTEEELGASSPVPPLPKLDITEYGDVINDDEIIDFVSDREEEFAYFFSAVLMAKENNLPFYINDTRENLVMWFAALQKALPLEIAKKIYFTTYVGNYTKFDDINAKMRFHCYGVRSGEYSFDYRAGARESGKVVLDFLGGNMTADIPVLSVARAIAESYTIGMDDIRDFSEFLRENNVMEFDRNLEVSYLAYSLIKNNSFDYTEENVKCIVEFINKGSAKSLSENLASKLLSCYNYDNELSLRTQLRLLAIFYKHSDYMMYSVHPILLSAIKNNVRSDEDYELLKSFIESLKNNLRHIYDDFIGYVKSADSISELETMTFSSGTIAVCKLILGFLLENKYNLAGNDAADRYVKKTVAGLVSVQNGEGVLLELVSAYMNRFDIVMELISTYLGGATEAQKRSLSSAIGNILSGKGELETEEFMNKALASYDPSVGIMIAESMIRSSEEPDKKFWFLYKTQFRNRSEFEAVDIGGLIVALLEKDENIDKASRVVDFIPAAQIKSPEAVRRLISCFEAVPFKRLQSESAEIINKLSELARLRLSDAPLGKLNAVLFLSAYSIWRDTISAYVERYKINVCSLDKKEYSLFVEEAIPMLMNRANTVEDVAAIFGALYTPSYNSEFYDALEDYFKRLNKNHEGKWLDHNINLFVYLVDNEKNPTVNRFFEEYRKYFYKLDDEIQSKVLSEAKRKCVNLDSKLFTEATQKEGITSKFKRFFKH